MNKTLNRQIMGFIWILFLALTILIVTSILFFVYTIEQETWLARQTEAAQNAAKTVEGYLRQNESILYWVDAYGYDEVRQKPNMLEKILKDYPAFMEIVLIDENGVVQTHAAREESTLANQFTIVQSEWFLAAKSGQKIYTRVQTSSKNESYTIFAMPSTHGGVIAAQIQMDDLWKTVSQIHFGKKGSVYIVNERGQVIAHPNTQIVLSNKSINNTDLLKSILQSTEQKWIGKNINIEGVKVTSASMPIESTDWIVISELPREDAYAISRLAGIVIPLGITIIMVFAILTLRKMLDTLIIHPLNQLRQGANQIGQGNLSHRLETSHQNELGEVMAVFNAMASDLESQREKLHDYTKELEKRVQERTIDLSLTNENLVREIKERKNTEAQLLSTLNEKEVLLKEIHHRVKNNLQIISSLLSLQSDRAMETGALQILRDSQARVRSMSLIHEKLYQSSDLAVIDFGEYVQSLTTDLFHSYGRGAGNVQLKIEVEKAYLDLDQAVPCGLILNELITNSLKYAFPNDKKGTLWVELRNSKEGKIKLKVADDGVGLPPNLNVRKTKSLGWQLINSLVQQLEGTLELENPAQASFLISFTPQP